MRRFFKNLFHNIRNTSKARAVKHTTRQAKLQMEGLEDRLVPTAVSFPSPGTLKISEVGQASNITIESNNKAQIVVLDNDTAVKGYNPVNKDSISTVTIDLTGDDSLEIDDSSGMPFASRSLISIQGSGENFLFLYGNRVVGGNEIYQAGVTSSDSGSIAMDNLEFQFTNAIASVNDFLDISGTLQVQTAGANVEHYYSPSGGEGLIGLGSGGGSTLVYTGKPEVQLVMSAPFASLIMDADSGAPSGTDFLVSLDGANEQATIVGTQNASDLITSVSASGSGDIVDVESASSTVLVQGDSTTMTIIGQPEASGGYSTLGIKANVSVVNSATLIVSDQADHTGETWDVTESTISGSGVFGNNFAVIHYTNVQNLNIATSTGANSVDVSGTAPSAGKTQINIADDSASDFTATITVNSSSALTVDLSNQSTNSKASASLFIDVTPSAKFSNTKPKAGDGTENVSYGSKVVAQVGYLDFTSVKLED